MGTVILKKVWKKYGKFEAVKDVDLEVHDKEFLCLLGPSGCGKSSTLRMIAGLESIYSGEIYIDNVLVNDVFPKDRDIAMAFENYALYTHMTVYGNIAFPLEIRGIDKEEIKKKVDEVTELLDIRDIQNERVKDLSGGAQQRVGVARALVREPKVLLLDEPISHLEAELRAKMREEIKRLQRSIGVTTIYVTHDQIEAMVMADRIAVMDEGKLLQVDSPANIYNHPSSAFVAGFIGEPPMNFLECELSKKNGKTVLAGDQFEIELTDEITKKLQEQGAPKSLKIGIRPSHINVSKDSSLKGSFKGEVYSIEPRNEDQILSIEVGDNLIMVETTIDFIVNTGDRIWVKFDMGWITIFDRESTLNLI